MQVSVGGQGKPNATRGIEEILRLYEEEGLIYPKIELLEQGAYAYGQIGKEEEAMAFAKKARQWWSWAVGKDGVETRRIEEFLKEPEKHPRWRLDVQK